MLKLAIVLAIGLGLSAIGLRWVFWLLLVLIGLVAAWIHLLWLRGHGIHGWTGEPKEKYYELLGVEKVDGRFVKADQGPKPSSGNQD